MPIGVNKKNKNKKAKRQKAVLKNIRFVWTDSEKAIKSKNGLRVQFLHGVKQTLNTVTCLVSQKKKIDTLTLATKCKLSGK